MGGHEGKGSPKLEALTNQGIDDKFPSEIALEPASVAMEPGVVRACGSPPDRQVTTLLERIEGLRTHCSEELTGESGERLMRAGASLRAAFLAGCSMGTGTEAAIGAAEGAIREACAVIERAIAMTGDVSQEAVHFWLERSNPAAAIRIGKIGRMRRRIFRQGDPPLERLLWVSEAPWALSLLSLGEALGRLEHSATLEELERLEVFAARAKRIVEEQGGTKAIGDPLVETLDRRWFRLMKLRFARDPWLRDPSALPALLLAAGATRWSANGAAIRGTSYSPPGMLAEELRDLLIRFELWPQEQFGGAP